MDMKSFVTKRPLFVFGALNMIFAVGFVYQYAVYMYALHKKQQLEKERVALYELKEERMQQAEALKNRNQIRRFATEKLLMKPMAIKQVKKISVNS